MSRGIRAAAIIVMILGAAAAVVLGIFRIQSIEVKGNERYLAEQIRDDLIYDFKTRNTLYFTWKYRSSQSPDDAPYLSSVTATMISPSSVRLDVVENQLIGRLQYGENNVYFDPNGVVQEISQTTYTGIPLITGIEIEEPQLYQHLVMDNSAIQRTMLNISQLLVQNGLIPDSVSFDSSNNMTLRIGTITVLLGQDEYLEEKIANLVSIYPEISNQSGTLDMEGFTGRNDAIAFRADGEEANAVSETEADSSGADTLAGEGADGNDSASEESAQEGEDTSGGEASQIEEGTGEEASAQEAPQEEAAEESYSTTFMVFDSSGTLRYDAHVVGGMVVDSGGIPIDGCYVDENGNAVDAYWNVIDPATGQLVQ